MKIRIGDWFYLVDSRNSFALESGALNALISFSRSRLFVLPSSPK